MNPSAVIDVYFKESILFSNEGGSINKTIATQKIKVRPIHKYRVQREYLLTIEKVQRDQHSQGNMTFQSRTGLQ